MAAERTLQVHAYLPESRANGPGLRAVLWLQGCTLACPGCFNPLTHAPGGGESLPVSQAVHRILNQGDRIEGLTLTGGEPFQQPEAVFDLLSALRGASDLSVLVFSGFRWEEIQAQPALRRLLPWIDVLIAGRYHAHRRLARGLVGSANKTVHRLTSRYTCADLGQTPDGEVLLTAAGEILLSGIDPLSWS